MSHSQAPSWYESGDIEQSLRTAFQRSNIPTEDIVDVLAEHELDASRDRILAMVETARNQITDGSSESDLSTPSIDETREQQIRYLDLTDLEYLGSRDAAYLIGTMLARFDGSFRVPESVDEEASDLVWMRSETTVGLCLEWRPDGSLVDKTDIQSVVSDSSQSVSDRDISEIAIVSNGGFTDEARELASEHEINCCGPDHLRQWCREAQITIAVAGEILSSDRTESEEIDTILEQLPALPASIPVQDPLQPTAKTEWMNSTLDQEIKPDTTETKSTETDTERIAQSGRSGSQALSDPGQQGVLYADPAEDGDYNAFDRFADALTDEDSS